MQNNDRMGRLLYVGMHDGVCAVSSADGGKTWRQSKVQPLPHAAARLSASASDPGRAYLAAYESKLYRTDDAGETWTSLDSYPSDYAHSVVVHPQDHQLVYAGTEPAAIFRSKDGGDSWEECAGFRAVPEASGWNFHIPTRYSHVRDLRMTPGNPNQLFAGIEVGGMMRSDDGGDSWQQLEGTNDDVHCIDMSPGQPRTVYVATARAGPMPCTSQLIPGTSMWCCSRCPATPGGLIPNYNGPPTAEKLGARSRPWGREPSPKTWWWRLIGTGQNPTGFTPEPMMGGSSRARIKATPGVSFRSISVV